MTRVLRPCTRPTTVRGEHTPQTCERQAAHTAPCLAEKLAGSALAFQIFQVAIRIPVPWVPQPPYGTHIGLSEGSYRSPHSLGLR